MYNESLMSIECPDCYLLGCKKEIEKAVMQEQERCLKIIHEKILIKDILQEMKKGAGK
jgi:hypothetical protein